MEKNARIVVLGHTGLVGSAVLRKLVKDGYINTIAFPIDLRDQGDVNMYFSMTKVDYVFLCAGQVGGILANNTRRAEFIYDNMMIQFNVIHAAHLFGVKKLLCLGSSCIYPRINDGAILENKLLTGELEPTNEPYAISKIAALKMCDAYRHQYGSNFISIMPCNMYGIFDSYDPIKSHVPAALIRKIIVAKRDNKDVVIWGTGTPRREFLFVDDMADACLFLMQNYNEPGHVNVGTGVDIELNELVKIISGIIGFAGNIVHDLSKPDGMPSRKLDVSKINKMGWKAKIELMEGLKITIDEIYKSGKHLEW